MKINHKIVKIKIVILYWLPTSLILYSIDFQKSPLDFNFILLIITVCVYICVPVSVWYTWVGIHAQHEWKSKGNFLELVLTFYIVDSGYRLWILLHCLFQARCFTSWWFSCLHPSSPEKRGGYQCLQSLSMQVIRTELKLPGLCRMYLYLFSHPDDTKFSHLQGFHENIIHSISWCWSYSEPNSYLRNCQLSPLYIVEGFNSTFYAKE